MTGIVRPDWPVQANVVAGTTTLLAGADELRGNVRFLNQVHGTTVVSAKAVRQAEQALDADAVTGWNRGDLCAVRTADCLPVLFCSRDGDEVAAAHAGWRGLAAGVLENTVAAMRATPQQLVAWLALRSHNQISRLGVKCGMRLLRRICGRRPASRRIRVTAGRPTCTGWPASASSNVAWRPYMVDIGAPMPTLTVFIPTAAIPIVAEWCRSSS